MLIIALNRLIAFKHYHNVRGIVGNPDDPLEIFGYDNIKQSRLHDNVWMNYKKKVKTLTGVTYRTARKTFKTIAGELAIPDKIRSMMVGHADPTMPSHYDIIKTERCRKQVDEAHRAVLKTLDQKE